MPTDLPKNAIKFLVSLLKNQAKIWLGEDAAGIAAQTFIDEDLQKRLDDWLNSEKTAKELIRAAQQAQLYLQNPRNCPDVDLRHLFRDMPFGDLSAVQTALSDLPQAMDAVAVTAALQIALARDVPNLSAAQCEEGARIYTDALLRAVGSMEKFTLPIILQTVLDLRRDLKDGQTEIRKQFDEILKRLESRTTQAPSPTLPGDLPIGSYLPFPRNQNFTGRVEDLKKLEEALLSELQPGVVINQAVTGMGGIGKTQLAVEFAYEYGHLFRGVHWLDLRDPQALDSQITLSGEKMGLTPWPEKLPEQVNLTLREWKRDVPRLLILDNFEDIGSVNVVLSRLNHSGLRLLITSRRTDWSAALGLKRLPLDEFTPGESREFLRKYLPVARESDAELDSLGIHLGHLPLALELAGRYLERHSHLKIKTYLGELEKALEHKSMRNWRPEQKSLTDHDLSLVQTFVLSWKQVKDSNTQKLFISCGYCAPNTPIPNSIFQAALGEQSESCDECLSELVGFGLLKEEPSIHPLLAQFAHRLDEENKILKQFSEDLAKLANSTNHEEDSTGNYKLYVPILPHIRNVAEHAEQEKLAPAGQLWNSLGYHVNTLADYAGAKAAYERAIKIWEANLGAEHPQVAIGVNNLGNVMKALGDLAGAKAAYERAIKIWEANLGAEHPQVAIGVNNLGLVLQALGDLAGAKAAYERALKINEATYGPDHPDVATDINNLGLVLQALGDLTGAKIAIKRALKTLEKFLPPDHPNIKIVRNNLESLK